MEAQIRKIAKRSDLTPEERTMAIQKLYTARSASSKTADALKPRKRCAHYSRGCTVLAECCNTHFGCRLCHDEASDHTIDRKATKRMRCRSCEVEQPVAAHCSDATCAWQSTDYFCSVCNLWIDGPSKAFFHCDECGICRVGAREDFVHCAGCKLCVPKDVLAEHTCLWEDACAVCGEALTTSRDTVAVSIECRHKMHSKCFDGCASNGIFRCPLCQKSLSKPSRASNQFVRDAIATLPMPQEYENKRVDVLCNDFLETSDVAFHFYGHECAECNSFNTSIV